MFEEDAKERTLKDHCSHCWQQDAEEEHRCTGFDYCSCYKDWQKGAEFGYNKANEWHKQDIDDIYDLISKDWSVRYFICIMKDKSRLTAIGNCDEGCNGEVSVNLFFDHDDDKYYIDDIVWWKEIILPKVE